MEAEYQLCPNCKGRKTITKGETYGYVGAHYRSWQEMCPICSGNGFILSPKDSAIILKKLLKKGDEG